MNGQWANGLAYYQCRPPPARLPAGRPKCVFVREDAITPTLDEWLARLFDVGCLEQTVDSIVAAQTPDAVEKACH
jgi:hypothetical protein